MEASSCCTETFWPPLWLPQQFFLIACAPPGSTPSTTATSGNITVTVNPVGPQEWGYAIATQGSANITKIVFTLSVSGCSVSSMPTGWRDGNVPGGIQIESATGAVSVNATLKCDATNGPMYVDAHVLGGAATTVGPVAGPT